MTIFCLQGHDTTSAAMNWFLHLMGNNPEIQARVHKEVDEVLGGDGREVTYEDLGNLRYLEACFKETLRLYPSVPLIGRQCTEDTQIGKLDTVAQKFVSFFKFKIFLTFLILHLLYFIYLLLFIYSKILNTTVFTTIIYLILIGYLNLKKFAFAFISPDIIGDVFKHCKLN